MKRSLRGRGCEHKPHKKLDLRNITHNANFCCKKFEFILVHEKEKNILMSGLKTMHQKGIPYYAIIHFYMKCTGMDQDFIFCGAGAERKTLKRLLHGRNLLLDTNT